MTVVALRALRATKSFFWFVVAAAAWLVRVLLLCQSTFFHLSLKRPSVITQQRHAYLDDLEAVVLRMPALYQTAIDRSDYHVAPFILATKSMMQTILSGISKPRSKLAIKASLDAGVLVRVEQLDAANFSQLTECLAEKSDVENQIAAAEKSAALNTAQLLAQEKAAAARQDFAAAGQLKAAKEASIQSGQCDVAQLQVCLNSKLHKKYETH